jgi:hypothetical protein
MNEREKISSSNSDDGDDDYELELEPPDPAILAGEQRRAQEALETTRMSIDIDEIYRESERDLGREAIENWFRGYRFRFQVKHLLIATAVLAILLTLYNLNLMVLVVIGVMLTIAGIYLYFQWLERKHEEEAHRRRQEMYARRREQLGKKSAVADAVASEKPKAQAEPLPPLPSEIDEIWEKANSRPEFRFQFSMQQLMAAMTVATIIFGMAHLLEPAGAATLLGLVALGGLMIHALGFDPPPTFVLGWWFILLLYVAMSLFSVVWSGLT